MEEGQKHIDDLFREELGNYTELPPEKVWEDLSQRLDDSRRPRFGGWWPWIVMLLLIGSVAGYMVISKKSGPVKPENTVAVIDKGLTVSMSDALKAESSKHKTEGDNVAAKPIDTTQRSHFKEDQLKAQSSKPEAKGAITQRNENESRGGAARNAPKAKSSKSNAESASTQRNENNSRGGTTHNVSGAKSSKPKAENSFTPSSVVAANSSASENKKTGKAQSTKPKAENTQPKAEDTKIAASNETSANTQKTDNKKTNNTKAKSSKPKAESSVTPSSVAATGSSTGENKKANKTKAQSAKPKAESSVTSSSVVATGSSIGENKKASKTKAESSKPKAESIVTPSNVVATGSSTGENKKANKTKAESTKPNAENSATPASVVTANSSTGENKKASKTKAENSKPKAESSAASSNVVAAKTASQKSASKTTNKAQSSKLNAQSSDQSATNNIAAGQPKAQTTNPKTKSNVPPANAVATGKPKAENTKQKAQNNTTADSKKPVAAVPAAEAAKKPLPQPKQENAVAQTNTFKSTPNPANNLLVKPAEESQKKTDEDKDEEDNGKTPMTDDDEEDNSKPALPQPAAKNDPRAGIPVSSYIDKAVAPQPKAEYDEDDAADKKKVAIENPAGGAGGNMSPSIGKDRKPASALEGGAKFGFEKGFSSVTSNKWVATIYLQYNLTPKAAFLVQPSVKFAQMNKSINSSQSFYNVTGTTISSTQRMDSTTTPPFFDTVYNYYYKQTYDSVHVSQTSTKNYVEFEIPVIFKYTIAENLSLLAGVTMNFGSIPTVSSSSTTYSGLTLQDSVVNIHNNPNYQISVNDSFHHTAAPLDSYNGSNNQNPSTNPIRFGYLLGMNYLLKDRVLFDLTVQQSFSKMTSVPNADIRSVLTQPYVRFSVGYKIFQSKKRAPQQ